MPIGALGTTQRVTEGVMTQVASKVLGSSPGRMMLADGKGTFDRFLAVQRDYMATDGKNIRREVVTRGEFGGQVLKASIMVTDLSETYEMTYRVPSLATKITAAVLRSLPIGLGLPYPVPLPTVTYRIQRPGERHEVVATGGRAHLTETVEPTPGDYRHATTCEFTSALDGGAEARREEAFLARLPH